MISAHFKHGQYQATPINNSKAEYKLRKAWSTYATAKILLSTYQWSKIIPVFRKEVKLGSPGMNHHLQKTTEADKN